MRVNVIPEQILLPLQSVKLGRFVTNFDHPHQNYHDPPGSQPSILLSNRTMFTGEHLVAGGSNFGSVLASLVSAQFSKQAKLKISVTTEHVKTYTLDNSDSWFEKATRLPATQTWVERASDRPRPQYLRNCRISYHDERQTQSRIDRWEEHRRPDRTPSQLVPCRSWGCCATWRHIGPHRSPSSGGIRRSTGTVRGSW
ncbi:hypothetical protein GGR51DRAFT_512373 [Nemania sp. FL0031]|nr:hypothetical protein GGR51DRAFT_512373 [Nemania sp. FL0031]